MSKLNPLKTKHDLQIVIDDKPYNITYKAMNKHIMAELDEYRNTSSLKYQNVDEKRLELKEALEYKKLNEEILKDVDLKNRSSILLEQKELVKNIFILEKEIKEFEKELESINDAIEDYSKKQFELTVTGEGKVELVKAIENAGISYSVINNYIVNALQEAIEKK
ncbi:hypothetical protein Q6A90_05015 [Aliarcobacter skirrowii]|jgi:hypothetical protein|uniref:Uncharacterized protein n=1 Tax=Aliarcobacter skirrowii TaxID=28200 RepID=A0AAW9DA78_9BACT|nr:hypothetical protein [Aliarcobacter skirrowii]MDX4061723.1 hypothetical protein [Aliarcobacter skirrowii]MDX4069119.1 hypothetical protein [Aliarcobacter skirrowii]